MSNAPVFAGGHRRAPQIAIGIQRKNTRMLSALPGENTIFESPTGHLRIPSIPRFSVLATMFYFSL